MYQVCKRCLMDNKSDKTIRFDSQGYCNYCSEVLKRKENEYFPDKTEKKIKAIFEAIKKECSNDKYDCMVGVSGGIDSSYILYLGHKYGLRMLAVHIDDGLDNPIALSNLEKLIGATKADFINIKPNMEEYADVLYALFKAAVPNVAIAQDNLIMSALQQYGTENGIKYILDGSNFANESILERDKYGVNGCDKKYILSIHKRFGKLAIENLNFMSLTDRYLKRNRNKHFRHLRPLNYIDYTMQKAIAELRSFCGFEYYGGKHYESILTRYMQLYYLPSKFGIDKRKSHYSSLIMSGQMTRDEAEKYVSVPVEEVYQDKEKDESFLAEYMKINKDEFDNIIKTEPRRERDYPHSILNYFASIARLFRKVLE